MTRIKFCGMTREEDVFWAANHSVDYIGIVRHPQSKRYVPDEDLSPLLCEMHSSEAVLVYQACAVSNLPARITVQAEEFSNWKGSGHPWLLTIRVLSDWGSLELQRTTAWLTAVQRMSTNEKLVGALVDPFHPYLAGGSGHLADWTWASELVKESPVPVILAGGLTPDNVAEAIRVVKPYAVDVSSGIESSPGIKDHGKMRAFVEAVRSTD